MLLFPSFPSSPPSTPLSSRQQPRAAAVAAAPVTTNRRRSRCRHWRRPIPVPPRLVAADASILSRQRPGAAAAAVAPAPTSTSAFFAAAIHCRCRRHVLLSPLRLVIISAVVVTLTAWCCCGDSSPYTRTNSCRRHPRLVAVAAVESHGYRCYRCQDDGRSTSTRPQSCWHRCHDMEPLSS